MKKKILLGFAVLSFVALPLFVQAQAHCRKVYASIVVSYGGYELHIEYWCCTGPEGCFSDVYFL
jgi:hypothetical protein